MAITRIKNIKTSKSGGPHSHLRRSIFYIVNPEKTEKCLWSYSNVGATPEEVYQKFLETKYDWEKPYGRQAYHIIISFLPGEGDPETAFLIGKQFAREFLEDAYDYQLAVHLDRKHLHVHLVFNSVNRITGLKYQYKNGDWEKILQPIVDELCKKYKLSQLEYIKEKKVGLSYGEDRAKKEERPTNRDILQNDIDNAIALSSSFDEYLSKMREYGYQIHIGFSEKRGCEYITYKSELMGKGRRDYKLPEGYSMDAIKKRIASGDKTIMNNPVLPTAEEIKTLHDAADTPLAVKYTSYVICARFYHSVKTVRFNNYAIRRDLMAIQSIRRECAYIIDHKLKNIGDVQERLLKVKAEEKDIKIALEANFNPSLRADLEAIREEKNILRRIIKREESHKDQKTIGKDEALRILLEKMADKKIRKELKYDRLSRS